MAFPEYIDTRVVTFGGAAAVESGTPLTVRAQVSASRALIWYATGYRLEQMPHTTLSLTPGVEVAFELPVTDKDGYLDAETREALVLGPDEHTHTYTVSLQILNGAQVLKEYSFGPFVVPTGSTPIDGDTMLLPDEIQGGTLVTIPEMWEQIISDASAVAGLKGLPNGIAELDSNALVPLSQIPLQGIADSSELNATIDDAVQIKRFPDPVNLDALAPFRAKLLTARKAPVIVTCVTNSIGWGVGVDGNPGQATGAIGPQQDAYREAAWPYQLASFLNEPFGTAPVLGWVGPGYSNVVSSWAAATDADGSNFQGSIGPFGRQSGVNRGGAVMAFDGYIEWGLDTMTRPFTAVDVFFWTDTVNPASPSVLIDGVEEFEGALAPAGGLVKITVDGLSRERHVVRLEHQVSSSNVYGAWIVCRNDEGVVVNRIGSPGAVSGDAINGTALNRDHRAAPAAVLPGYSDLVIIQLHENDEIYQVDPTVFKSNLEVLIDTAACPVLLLDGLPNGSYGPLGPPDYRAKMMELVSENSAQVAFASLFDLFGGSRAEGRARGLFASGATVHPSYIGATLIAEYVANVLQRNYVQS